MGLLKTSLLLSVFAIFTVQAQSETQSTVYGGLTIATGDEAEYMNPGIALGFDAGKRIGKFVSLGGHFDYEWLTEDIPADYDARVGYHFWDISFVPKVIIPFTDKVNMSLEVDPGFCLSLAYIHLESYFGNFDDREADPNFILTPGITFNVSKLALAFKFKRVFGEYGNSNFVTFNVGYNLN